MSAIDPDRAGTADHASPSDRKEPDRWGVKRAENLIQSLQGVLSARVVVSPIGEVTEVHVLTTAGQAPKQVVRNVESALLAHLGVKVDHRRISVAQTADVQPLQALEEAAVKEEARRRGIMYRGLDVKQSSRQRVVLSVTLEHEGDTVSGEDEVADTAEARFTGTARATVAALDKILPEGTLELAGIKRIEAFNEVFAFAGVQVLEGRDTRILAGSARMGGQPDLAAILAVLDAMNRWMGWMESRR